MQEGNRRNKKKKKWKNARPVIKKKDANRGFQMKKTGGGLPPESVFKPWKLDVCVFKYMYIPEIDIIIFIRQKNLRCKDDFPILI